MSATDKHIDAAIEIVDSDEFKALMAVDRIGKCAEMVAAALSTSHREGFEEGMKRAAAFVLFHNNGSNKWREVASSLSNGITLCPACDGQKLMHGYDCDCPTCGGTGFARTPASEAERTA